MTLRMVLEINMMGIKGPDLTSRAELNPSVRLGTRPELSSGFPYSVWRSGGVRPLSS
jgi:hypothetical protein